MRAVSCSGSDPPHTPIRRQVWAGGRSELDRLVYQLYELTDDEIKIVEAASEKR